MPTFLLANQYTLLSIINIARAIIYGVIPNLNSKDFLLRNTTTNQE